MSDEKSFDPTICPLCLDPTPALSNGVCDEHARLLNVAAGVVGRVKKVHAPGEWKGPGAERPVTVAVIELESGDAFVAERGCFMPLTVAEMRLYGRLVSEIGRGLASALSQEPPPTSRHEATTARALAQAALSASLRRLARTG